MDKYTLKELNNGYAVDLYLDGESFYALLNQVVDTCQSYFLLTGTNLNFMNLGFRLYVDRKSKISLQDGKNSKQAMSMNFVGILGNLNEKDNVEVQSDGGDSGW